MASKKHGKRSKKRLFYDLMLISVIPVIIAWFTSSPSMRGSLEVTFIDVDQGDCSLIKAPDGKALLIDAGEKERYEDSVLSYLMADGLWKIDSTMASHYHSDHAGSILELLNEGYTKSLFIPKTPDDGDIKENLIAAAESHKIKVTETEANDKITLGSNPNVKLEVLFPNPALFTNSDKNPNNDSIVLRLDYCGLSFLFTGDIESDAEKVLMNSAMLNADVLKVAHHGSSTSTTDGFLDAVSPKYAVIEVGMNNKYGHPHDEVLNRLKERNIELYQTDICGNISFFADKSGIYYIRTEKN